METIEPTANQTYYKAIWKCKTSPKLHLFLWKIAQRALALGENLAKRGLTSNVMCRHCGELETAEHIFLQCQFTREIWNLQIWPSSLSPAECTSFSEVFFGSASLPLLPPWGLAGNIFPWVVWGIWTARNYLIFENRAWTPLEILTKAFYSQSSHVFANNISSMDTAIDVELGELNLHLADEYQQCYKENILGTEPNSGLLMHIEKISLNWARRDCRNDLVLSVNVTTMSIYLSYKRVESLTTNAVSFEALVKKLTVSGEKTNKTGGVELSHATEKETRLANLTLTRFIVNFCDATGLDNTVTDSVSLEVTGFSFSLNKDKHSTEMEFLGGKAIYQLYIPCSKVTLFDMNNGKLTRLSGGLDINFLLSSTDISLGWEPDVHLYLYGLYLRLSSLAYAQNVEEHDCVAGLVDVETTERKSIFAIDVEMLTISAGLGDGVEVKFNARSIFTENAFIGMLVEELMLALNGSRVLKTTRMQLSRIPTVSLDLSDDIVPVRTSGPWDWNKLRDLKLIAEAEEESLEPKNSSPGFGRLRFCIGRLNAYIEEEPIQGWLDEHYLLLKKETCELAVRLKFVEDFIHKASHKGAETSERKIVFDGDEIDVHDPLAISKVKEEIQKRSFRSYYQACQGLVPSEGSGACREGFQAGFKSSAARNSLLSVCATDFDLNLTAVRGCDDDAGLMEVLRKLDPSCKEISGSKVYLKTGSLVVKLRNYTLPLLSASSCKCEGPIVQQAMSSQPHSDLRICFEQGEVSFGVGYEPAFADISYAFTVALSPRSPCARPQWNVLATTDPYESQDKLQIVTGPIEFKQSDGRVVVNAKDFKIKLRSRHSLNVPAGGNSGAAFFEAPLFNIEVTMDWECEPGSSLNVLDPLRSASLSLRCNLSLRPIDKNESISRSSPTINLGAQDLAWILKCCSLYSDPPHKLRSFSGRPRFGVPRVVLVAEDLSLDQVMTEFMVRVDATPFLINYMPSDLDDPAKGLIFDIKELKYELCYSRGKQNYTLECKRDALDLVYQGLDVHVPKGFINKDGPKGDEKNRDAGFLLSCDYCTIRRQAPKADIERLSAWQEAGRKNLEVTYLRSEFANRNESDEDLQSDPSDDDGYNRVLSDNCQRVFVYGLKLLWTIENRDAVFSFVSGISKGFEPSPSRQYTQSKILEGNQKNQEETSTSSASSGESRTIDKVETSGSHEEGTSHFMVKVIEPQFNLHSEEANGSFLLAAASGRVIARSFKSIMRVDEEVIVQFLGTTSLQSPKRIPEMTCTRLKFSVMLEHVQAHVALTDVDPGAGVQWLPNIRRSWGAVAPKYSKKLTKTEAPRKSSLHFPTEDDDAVDEVVPYGNEEVEIAKINLKEKEWEQKLLLDDIQILSHYSDNMEDTHVEKEGDSWMISSRKSILVERLKKELLYVQKSRKMASASLRSAQQKSANLEKNKSAPYAMYISLEINRVVWCMLVDGRAFAEADINNMVIYIKLDLYMQIYDFERDYKDIGVARFTTKFFVVRNCLCNATSDMILSAWNPPSEWGKYVFLACLSTMPVFFPYVT
ncbi:hypothetical protein F2Q68_00039053 [Brassica cretica]|uniref:FMP27/BLTP2/Hobbit GFWDK motif-containing RBG unit domain-containing protein n=1 Tax=Brassica cretica TaxID=69181 RepID=A0A8S9MBP7_BRACR|nr:hypothetical protein F2Q68_00039053 [Brassica cretica]